MIHAIKIGVRFLDNIIDINKFPHKIYENYQKLFRTIGFGVTGLADMLAMLNMKYNSVESQKFVNNLMNFISFNVYKTSIELAKEKGSFEFLDKEKFVQSNYLKKHVYNDIKWQEIVDGIEQFGIRNAKLMSIAPTGTLSLTFGNNCSSGIEPIFSLSLDRKVKIGGQSEANARIVKMQDYAYGLWLSKKENNIVDKDKFITATEMSVEDHLNMLRQITWHTDMSVSKTINVPSNYSFEDTKEIYMKAWQYGIKGCTIFRPNEIRHGILISDKEKQIEKKSKNNEVKYDSIQPISRKAIGTTHGNTYCKKCACGTLYITVNRDDNENIVETFVHTSKGGICQANTSAVNRMISLSMRSGVKLDEIIDQLKGINCPACVKVKTKGEKIDGISCPDIIAKTLMEFKNNHKSNPQNVQNNITIAESNKNTEQPKEFKKCPDCGEYTLRNEGGCDSCQNCGYSHCG